MEVGKNVEEEYDQKINFPLFESFQNLVCLLSAVYSWTQFYFIFLLREININRNLNTFLFPAMI